MLAEEDLDVVSVCTPSLLHRDHVVDAARSAASPDVIWCEKPIASSVSDAEEMVALCDETDTELVVNHSFRFTDKLQTLRSLVQDEDSLGHVHLSPRSSGWKFVAQLDAPTRHARVPPRPTRGASERLHLRRERSGRSA